MSRDAPVYDLGNIDEAFVANVRSRIVASEPRREARRETRPLDPGRFDGFIAALVRSLSLFVPGATQVVRGQITLGIFYASALVFLGSLVRAVIGTFDRLALTLDVLGQSIVFVLWTLGIAYFAGAAVHLGAIWTAMDLGRQTRQHPLVSGLASAIVPGWGQLLNGDRIRTVIFVASLWVVGAAWLASSSFTTELLNSHVPIVSPFEQSARAPFLLWSAKWTAPFLIWGLAVYDAAASAAARRHEA